MMRRRRMLARCLAATAAALSPAVVATAQEISLGPNLIGQLRHLHVGLKSGRITAESQFSGHKLNASNQSGDRREQLTIDLTGAAPSVRYELSTATFLISVEVDGGTAVRIRRTPQGDAEIAPLELFQPPEGKTTVVVGEALRKKSYAVDTLWHLALLDPPLVAAELEPLLRLLRPGWPIAARGRELEELLFQQIDAERQYDRRSWAAWVELLGSDKFAERRRAERRLRELGRTAVPYLRNLDAERLDPEQMFRIRSILRSFGGDADEDTPETAAAWLAADPEIWYALATHAAAARRSAVRTQLALVLGEPVVLDDDADASRYAEQLAVLRAQIDRLLKN